MYSDSEVKDFNGPDAKRPGRRVSPFDLLLALARSWKLILGVPFVVTFLFAGFSLFLPNLYTAKAMILPGEDNGGVMGAMMAQMGTMAGLPGGLGAVASKGDLYVTMLKSEVLKDPIIDRYKLMQLYQVKFRTKAQKELAGSSAISLNKKDGVITIAVENEDPKLAADLANSYVEELGKLTAKLSSTGAGVNRAFLEERLAKAKAELVTAEDTLKSFQSRNKAVAVTDQAKATLEGVAQLRAQLVAQEVQLATLQQQFSPQSREVQLARATIANLRQQIARLEGSEVEGSMPGVGSMPQLGQEYLRLMREFKVQETLVELLTKQYEMSKLNEAKDMAPFQVLQSARVPELKSGPKRGLLSLMVALSSLLLVSALVLLREFWGRMDEEDRKRWQELQRALPLSRVTS